MSEPAAHATAAGVAPAVDAATVILVRPTSNGVETLLLERHVRSEFGGALVFPGGIVDEQDRAIPPERVEGRDPAAWRPSTRTTRWTGAAPSATGTSGSVQVR